MLVIIIKVFQDYIYSKNNNSLFAFALTEFSFTHYYYFSSYYNKFDFLFSFANNYQINSGTFSAALSLVPRLNFISV